MSPQVTIDQAMQSALQHHKAGRLQQAEQMYRQVLALQPEHADAMHYLGVIAHQVGRDDVAAELIRRATQLKPGYAEAYSNLGDTLWALGKLDEAIVACRQAIELKPGYAEAYSNLGNALRDQDKLDEAIAAYRQAISLRSNYVLAHNNLGVALEEKGQFDEAIAEYRQSIALQPAYAEAHSNLGNALKGKGQLDEAVVAYRQAITLRPNLSEPHYNLGNALKALDRLDEAIAAYQQAIALNPNLPAPFYNLGNTLHHSGRHDEAAAAYRRALALNPDLPDAHLNLALTLLLQGDFAAGCRENEWRWKYKDFPSSVRDFAQPQWQGEELNGRTVLLHAEQGLGDTIQFVRYAAAVASRGGRVLLECPTELYRLLKDLPGVSQVLVKGQPLPPFDLQCPLASLLLAFETRLETIPAAVPYLHADPQLIHKWAELLTDASQEMKIGLAWAGSPTHSNDKNRSLKLRQLSPLSAAKGVRFYSLQKGPAASQAEDREAGLQVTDFRDKLTDLAETAALIANLDLIITVDTAVAHLAGAMGKPVWVLLPFVPDWRWLLNREDSPWYPTMRLFRQKEIGQWDEVIARLAERLNHCTR
jgi:tetratricopeptide (TPR) repeat protein